jgi:EAL domain-containing protein (putative c-di-GMP-specific phosphodiesterase class I)/GGDEF domain-containing protein
MTRHDEDARLDALYRLNLLDTAPSESFDRITRMASQIFGLPIAAVSLTDRDRQWFKSRVGVSHWSIPRDKAPCAEVAESAHTLLIPDLLADDCYKTSILADQGVRFYAGASLTTREGYSLGALCVLGTEPREATETEMSALNDLAKMVMAQIELQHAFGRLDPQSGLPNRTQFLEDLADLGRDQPGARRLVALVDLARHEQLANGLRVMGSAYLDRVVQQAADHITKAIGRDRTAYHVAATQFAFLAKEGVDERSYVELLARLLNHFSDQSNARFVMTTSIGVAPFKCGETTPQTILRTAHSAAQDARSSTSLVAVYSADADELHQRRFRLLNDFGNAVRTGEGLSLVFQPRVALPGGLCVGAEALLRWHHPELGPISPAEFIPIVEQTSVSRRLTAWVLEAAMAQLAKWRSTGLELVLSVNASASNLEEADFAQQVQLTLLKHRLPPGCFEVEVTESGIMQDIEIALEQLNALNDAGVTLAIDDFGTGYSSLAYLQRLPAKVLKIDQSFVREVGLGERQRTLVSSMITLAHAMGHRVVAEGVETDEVLAMLNSMECDEAQGYLFARPLDAASFEAWHAENERVADRRVAA